MKTIQVYDKPMCCSTGVCGPQVDPVLPRFAADLDWLQSLGHRVERYNLAQQPQAFVENSTIQQEVTVQGTNCLPIILIDGEIVSQKVYPSRDMLATWTGVRSAEASLPIMDQSSCCGDSGCC